MARRRGDALDDRRFTQIERFANRMLTVRTYACLLIRGGVDSRQVMPLKGVAHGWRADLGD